MLNQHPFKDVGTNPKMARLDVKLHIVFPLSHRKIEDLLHERGNDASRETVRFWWNGLGPVFAAETRKKRVSQMSTYTNGQWHPDEVIVKISGETHYHWRAVDHEGEALESYATKTI